jgi:hypothetical protein
MHIGEIFDKSAKALLAFRGEPYGLQSDSPYDLYKAVDAYKLGDEIGQIRTPLLITDPEPLSPAQRDARVFDWLDGHLG